MPITQETAKKMLFEMLEYEPLCFNECTGITETCKVDECMLCSMRDCEGSEPLHYHHDGCPYCDVTSPLGKT